MKITELLNLKWNYQMTEELLALLLDNEKRLAAFERYLATNPDLSQDCFLAEFQAAFAERSALKQDYTPASICRIVAQLSGEAQSVLDVCCGTGALTIAKWHINPNATFYCEEYSKEAIAILLFNLAVRGINAEVRHCDVLTGETFTGYKLIKEGQFSHIEQTALNWQGLQVDCVISNPPYSLRWQPKNEARFAGFDLAPKSKADYAFLLHGLYHLKESGTACMILPHGTLFRGAAEGNIRRQLIEKNYLDGVIGLPEKLFLATNIPVALLVLKKVRPNTDIFIMNAENLCEKQKPNNIMTVEHIQQVIGGYQLRRDIDKFAHLADLTEIKENDYNLNIPRYVNTFQAPPPPNLLQEVKELLEIQQQLEKTSSEFLALLAQIECTSGTEAEKQEFEQAKQGLMQVFAPHRPSRAIEKVINNNPSQPLLFDDEELAELQGFIGYQEQKIAKLQNIKKYFLHQMFI